MCAPLNFEREDFGLKGCKYARLKIKLPTRFWSMKNLNAFQRTFKILA